MKKLVFVLLDGLHCLGAKEHLGYLEHLTKHNQCAKYLVEGELPSLSRPMYETIFTGLPVYKHGIVNNGIQALSSNTSVFDLCKTAGLSSTAVAYHWISELYVKTPFNMLSDCILEDKDKKIQHGFFYYEDTFPDSHLYSIASQYIQNYQSDFVFIHPMSIDDAGHRFGGNSKEYSKAVCTNDFCLSTAIPLWQKQGYSIIVGSDHGMSEIGYHGGNSAMQRNTALYIIDKDVNPGKQTKVITTLQFAPLFCKILNLNPSKEMQELEVDFDEK